MSEPAVAGGFIDGGARMSARRGVGQTRGKTGRTSVLFARISEHVPADAVVERKLARDLPGVLREPGIETTSAARIRRLRQGHTVHAAQQQARVGETSEETTFSLTCTKERIIGLIRAEGEVAASIGGGCRGVAVKPHLAAELVTMVSLHPAQAEVAGGPLEQSADLPGGRAHRWRAAQAVRPKSGLPNRDAGSGAWPKRPALDSQHFDHIEIGDRRGVSEVVDDVACAKVQQHRRRHGVIQVPAPGARIDVRAARLSDGIRKTFGKGESTRRVLHLSRGGGPIAGYLELRAEGVIDFEGRNRRNPVAGERIDEV